MNFNQELYREFRRERQTNQSRYSISSTLTKRRKDIMSRMANYSDEIQINLQLSIELLRELHVIEAINDVADITTIMQNMKKSIDVTKLDEKKIIECRLIYFLWEILAEQYVQLREIKELIMLLLDIDYRRKETFAEIYGENTLNEQLIEAWDTVFNKNIQVNLRESVGKHEKSWIHQVSLINNKQYLETESQKQKSKIHQRRSKDGCNNFFDENQKQNNQFQSNFVKNNSSRLQKTFAQTKRQHTKSKSKVPIKYDYNMMIDYLNRGLNSEQELVNFFSNQETLTPQDQTKLIQRLYKTDKYKMRQEQRKRIEEEKEKRQMQECTFQPFVQQKKSMSVSKIDKNISIKNYKKSIERIKNGYQKQKDMKELLEFRSSKYVKYNSKAKFAKPPNFLSRVKEEQKILFQLQLQVGKYKIRIKIRESDKISDLAERVCKIYSLNENSKMQIEKILEQNLDRYFEEQIVKNERQTQKLF